MNINEIKEQANKFSRVTDPRQIETFDLNRQDAPKYEGTFAEIYDMVLWGKIKLLTQGDQVVGISVNSGTNNVEMDNLAGRNFSKAYCCKDVMAMVKTAMALNVAGLGPDDIVEDKDGVKIYLYSKGKVINIYGDTLAELGEGENATYDNIREILDAKMVKQIPISRVTDELPDTEVIESGNVDASSLKSIRAYLKNKYHNCLEKGTRPDVDILPNGDVKLTNIRWGRPMVRGEVERLG